MWHTGFLPLLVGHGLRHSTSLSALSRRHVILSPLIVPSAASARIFLDPAMYGDQELRVSAVDSLRESVRRALLQKPSLAPHFFELALLDCLSYDAATDEGGPDGSVVMAVMMMSGSSESSALQECGKVLLEAKKSLKKMSSITLADAVALAGAEAVAAVGGPVLPCQLGRMDGGTIPKSMPPLDLFVRGDAVEKVFRRAGLTEREMTALLGCLWTVDVIEKAVPEGDWKKSQKPKFREPGKMGRMSEFKPLTDEDVAKELAKEEGEETFVIDGDDDWYIADTFGTQEDRFGKRLGAGEKRDFGTAFKDLERGDVENTQYGWIREFLLSKDLPTAASWVSKYGSKPLVYEKDLRVAYNAVTQLGAEFTGGKYESLLKNKKRKTLNDNDLDFLK